ncbi:hypothetical protein IFM89_005732 [Coptis chinensis]|uniref:Uncharacterized protein n=1 Tax=Coptis chinensis TaxID=261450 RepID=A0A835M4C7_9MAGN|nr:hypothetical protein IFM89_005732 [Coptis chinensis]
MAYGSRTQSSSIFDVFSLNPLPYPVILILALIFIFLGTSYYFNYESVVEATEENFSLVLKVTPVVLLILVRWLSSMDSPGWLFARSPYDRQRATHHHPPEGTSPWGVMLLIIVLLVMVSYQSSFLDSWFA